MVDVIIVSNLETNYPICLSLSILQITNADDSFAALEQVAQLQLPDTVPSFNLKD
jgi:hypothetical protein